MTKEERRALLDAYDVARDAEAKIRSAIDEEKRITCAAIDAKYAERLGAAREASRSAERCWRDARDAEALANAKPKYPVGTVMVEWTEQRWPSHGKAFTGRRGMIEVWTRESVVPGNVTNKPWIGITIIRLLKKDGTPSTQFVSGSWVENCWIPEGSELPQ